MTHFVAQIQCAGSIATKKIILKKIADLNMRKYAGGKDRGANSTTRADLLRLSTIINMYL